MAVPLRNTRPTALLLASLLSACTAAGGEPKRDDSFEGQVDWTPFTQDVHAIEDRWIDNGQPTSAVWFLHDAPFGPPALEVAFRVSSFTAPSTITLEVSRSDRPNGWLPVSVWTSDAVFSEDPVCVNLAIPAQASCEDTSDWQIKLVNVDRYSLANGSLETKQQFLLRPRFFMNAGVPSVMRRDGLESLTNLPDVFSSWSLADESPSTWDQPSIDEARPVEDLPDLSSAIGRRVFPLDSEGPGDVFWLVSSSNRISRFSIVRDALDGQAVRVRYSTADFDPSANRLPLMPPFEERTLAAPVFLSFDQPSLALPDPSLLSFQPSSDWDLFVLVQADFAPRPYAVVVSPAAVVANATQLDLDTERVPHVQP